MRLLAAGGPALTATGAAPPPAPPTGGTDCSEKGNQRQEVKLNVARGRSLKTVHRKKSGKEHKSSKITLVTLWASQEEEEEETDDFEPDDEGECFAPEEVNKAPVFVPKGLRSPKPIPVQIEETMEEVSCSCVLHIYFRFSCLKSFYSNTIS